MCARSTFVEPATLGPRTLLWSGSLRRSFCNNCTGPPAQGGRRQRDRVTKEAETEECKEALVASFDPGCVSSQLLEEPDIASHHTNGGEQFCGPALKGHVSAGLDPGARVNVKATPSLERFQKEGRGARRMLVVGDITSTGR
jgi:hypothetical protein